MSSLKEKKVNIDGKRHSVYYRTNTELINKIAKLRESISEDAVAKTKFKTVAEAFQQQHDSEVEYYTADCYKRPFKDVIDYFGGYDIAEIKPKDIQAMLDTMGKQGYARQTINLRKIVLNLIFNYALFNELITVNPCKSVKVPKGSGRTKREPPPKDCLKTIIQHATDDYISFYVFLCAVTGCRKSEILALYSTDFDFNNQSIFIHQSLVFKGNTPVLRPYGKSDSANRVVPILPEFKSTIRKYVKKQGDAPIINVNGQHPNKGQFDRAVRRYCRENEITVTSHQLRHLFCSLLAQTGTPLKQAQAIMGHSKIETTMDTYTHALEAFDPTRLNQVFSEINDI